MTGAAGPSPNVGALRVDAVVLAAGLSRRTGRMNKLLAPVDGVPMVAQVVHMALASRAARVVVVTGHESERVAAALDELPVQVVHNDEYESGLASSLRAGIDALEPGVDGALICLADMPSVDRRVMDALVEAFDPPGRSICVPTCDGERGNPVLWGSGFFKRIRTLSGDEGARQLLSEFADQVVEVPLDDQGILQDFDTPEDFGIHADGEHRVVTQD